MNKQKLKIISTFLVAVLLFNILPLSSFAVENQEITHATEVTFSEQSDTRIVEEITENRTEFSKEFKMSNGLHMATVYSSAVHYEKNGVWEEIDNTLLASVSGIDSVYTNAAGVWDVSFPAQLSSGSQITISKDGYTLRFGMAGQLSNNGSALMDTDTAVMSAVDQISSGNLGIELAQNSTAQIQEIDTTTLRAEAEYPETIADKLNSRLQYNNVYSNTNVVYDLQSNMLKESVIIKSYDSDLRGYCYTLDVGTMIPVCNDDNSIWFYDSAQENVVMTMPAPFMLDADNAYCPDVQVALQGSGSTYTLVYMLPQEWMASEDRSWPVILDPVIAADIDINNIRDICVAEDVTTSYTDGSISCGYGSIWGIHRFFVKYSVLPDISSSDVIVGASMELVKYDDSYDDEVAIEVHKVLENWNSESLTWSNQPHANGTVEDFACVAGEGYYYWDVTDIARGWYEGENTGMMFKAPDSVENGNVPLYKNFYSSDFGPYYKPTLRIFFRNNNGLESYWDYTTSSAGRAGTGYVNNYTGNLVWIHNDIGFGGNRMPVSISHVYNANDSQDNPFGLGYGWRTNFNQIVYQWKEDSNYYVWEDGDGTKHYFLYDSEEAAYLDEDGLELRLTTTGSGTTKYCITDKLDNKSYFDTYGRLTRQENNQATVSSINITYTSTSDYFISQITDGAGRVYSLTYPGDLLDCISYKGTGSNEISYVTFGYSGSNLTSITSKDGETVQYEYNGKYLTNVIDIDGYELEYSYNTPEGTWQPYRVMSINESHGETAGGELSIQYDHNQTTLTDHDENQKIIQFNNWGNAVSIQDGEGRAQYAKYATDYDPENGKGNQLITASKLQNTVGNLFTDNSFEPNPQRSASNVTISNSTDAAYYGSTSLKVVTTAATGAEITFTAAAGKTYTFSAYVKTVDSAACLTLGGVSSEQIAANSDWTRLEVSYTNSTASAQTVAARLMNSAAGTTFMDCIQLELSPTASRYNLITNGDFRSTNAWSSSSGRTTDTSAAPQLSTHVYKLSGTFTSQNRISQTVQVSGDSGDTFVLAGWAKGNAAPLTQFVGNTYDSSSREFAIIAVFNYIDENQPEEIPVRFNPDVDNWQYTAAPIVAKQAYSSITVYLAYDYNANDVLFDGIQLYKEEFGSTYAYDEDGNVISAKDAQGAVTRYEYVENDLTKQILPNNASMTYTYDDHHNVISATTSEGVVCGFSYDPYGNNNGVFITSGGTSICGYAAYTADGNRLADTTDAMGQYTQYNYDENTNELKSVRMPGQTYSNRTNYTYDSMYRMATASMAVSGLSGGTALTVNYTYDNDYLTSIQTGTTEYSFSYGAFGLTSEVSIGDKTLAEYSYTDRTNYLSALDYGNGDKVQYTYDQYGRTTTQTYEDGDTLSYRYNNDGDLATVADSGTGKTTTYYYDGIDRLRKYVEEGADFSHSVEYGFDTVNNLTTQTEITNGHTRFTKYSYDADNRVTEVMSKITGGNNSWIGRWNYTYDSYNRVAQRETKNETWHVMTETFGYQSPGSGKTSGRVSSINYNALQYNSTLTYTYDSYGNIASVSDGTNTTSYEFDSAGQLKRENNQAAGKTWVYTYDKGGNIVSKKEYAYTTGTLGTPTSTKDYTYDTVWGDLLIGYNGATVTSDDIGNTLYDGTRTYTWEHGRQLATLRIAQDAAWNFTYDTGGMRTHRTDGTDHYSYVYNGGQLTQVRRGNDTVDIAYADGRPMSLTLNNDTSYFYVTNLQGDVIALMNTSGRLVVKYTYDAWGRPLYTYDNTGKNLWLLNPLRYRGYVYDEEYGLYYLQSRYYNPETGRFINADDTAYLGTGGLTSYNLFAYSGNNPVMGYDPYGTFDLWGFVKGVGRIVTGIAAVAVGVAVCVAGAPVAMIAVAAVTITAGVLTAVNGAADIQQSVTGNNFVRDTVFNGNQTAYDVYSGVTETVAIVGTAVCGNHLSTNCTMKGAVSGTEGKVTLEPGTTLDRYGSQYGRYLTDPGTPINQLALTPGNSRNLTTYVVNRPITFRTGVIAPCPWGPGGGVQYFSWMSVQRLVQFGFLTPLG